MRYWPTSAITLILPTRKCHRPTPVIPTRSTVQVKFPAGNIGNHLVTQGSQTLWIVNKSNVNTLLVAGDVDDKEGNGDAQGLAEYFRDQYLGGHGYIEPSRSGKGRHIYFVLDVQYIPRPKVWSGMLQWARLLQRDHRVLQFGAVFDRFLGLPMLWEEREGRQVIEKRGNLLKVPYLPNNEEDLQRLQNLIPLSFKAIISLVEAGRTACGSGRRGCGLNEDGGYFWCL